MVCSVTDSDLAGVRGAAVLTRVQVVADGDLNGDSDGKAIRTMTVTATRTVATLTRTPPDAAAGAGEGGGPRSAGQRGIAAPTRMATRKMTRMTNRMLDRSRLGC